MKRIRNLLLTLCFLLGGLFLLVPAEAAGTAGREPLARKTSPLWSMTIRERPRLP